MDVFFNRQSASIYEPTVLLLSALYEADFIQSSQRLEAQWAEPVFAYLSFCFEETL